MRVLAMEMSRRWLDIARKRILRTQRSTNYCGGSLPNNTQVTRSYNWMSLWTAEHTFVQANRVDARFVNHQAMRVLVVEMSCQWLDIARKRILRRQRSTNYCGGSLPNITNINFPRRYFAQKAKSRGGTLVIRAYIKESTYSWNIRPVCQKKISLSLNRGREESVGNDVSIVCARKYEMVRMT